MRIAITGVTGFGNRGVEALVLTTIEQLLIRFPDAEIIVATWTPDYDQKRFGHPQVKYVYDSFLINNRWTEYPTYTPPKKALWRRIVRYGLVLMKLREKRVVAKYKFQMPFDNVDLVIVSGGDLFSSVYGSNFLNHWSEPTFWAKERNVKCVMLGQTVGEFTNENDKNKWLEIEQNVKLITLRDEISLKYIKNEFPDSNFSYNVTADSAFLLDYKETIGIQKRKMIGNSYVAISVSNNISHFLNTDHLQHIQTWVELIKMILNEWNQNVVIITHVQEKYSDDRLIATEIWRCLDFDSRINICGEDLSASEFKSIISKSELLIAERMHAAIAGFSTGICTVTIGYSIKAMGLVNMIFKADSNFNQSELVIPYKDFIVVNSTQKKLNEIWTNRKIIEIEIDKNINRLSKAANMNFDIIHELLEN